MKKIIILLLMINICAQAQIRDFFKYSTFYTSMSMGTSMMERDNYIAIDKGYEDVTQVNPYDYNLTIIHFLWAPSRLSFFVWGGGAVRLICYNHGYQKCESKWSPFTINNGTNTIHTSIAYLFCSVRFYY